MELRRAVSDDEFSSLKVPPHSMEAEQAVLGGLLVDNNAWERIGDRLAEGDFYRNDHRLIFRSLATLAERHQPLDVVTVSDWLKAVGKLDEAGGIGYLATLASDTPSSANIVAYAEIVRDRAVMRALIQAGTTVVSNAFRPEGRSSAELIETAERIIFDIAETSGRFRKGFVGVGEILPLVVKRIDFLYQQAGNITGLATGFSDLDEMTSGLQNGDLVIVAARPSMGKTTFAMNIAEQAALRSGLPVAVFSMEMPAESLAMRMMSSLGRIPLQKLRSGKLEEEDWPRLTSTMGLLSDARMFIDDSPGLSPQDMRSRARRLKREHGLGLIVVDYLQLMQVPGSKENRTGEISEISRGLKSMAKELEVPVVALSQLNRSLEQRPNKRPVMSDLRESGAIEQDADVILFIYRDEVYNEDSPDKGTAEIIISKQRNGPIGNCRLTFLGQYTRFENLARHLPNGGY